jgi:formylglycine-generating enzyme required for sulfatase activity/mono/diheme cytochrome c family protein
MGHQFLLIGGIALLSTTTAFAQNKVDFRADVAPIFEQYCVECHHAGNTKADLEMSSRKDLLDHRAIVPGKPDQSVLYTMMKDGLMPPGKRLSDAQLATVRNWIAQDADWPVGLKLVARKPSSAPAASQKPGGEDENVRRIRERIVAKEGGKPAGSPAAYKVTIPNTTVSYEMAPIPAGDFMMGSPDSDPQHKKDEQPQHKVHVDAFWMQAHEVTWDEYRLFMFANQAGEIANKDNIVDGVSRPTRPYVEMSFGMGINGFPAISMTQHAANKYAEWLSAKTGEFYRLPTEAEWEYACRAGTTTPYYFGADASKLGDYAWYSTNSSGKYQPVATKKPNPWGLYDMLGNVMEWTLDEYEPYSAAPAKNPWVKATKPYPQAVRGGSWNDTPDMLRCASRVASDASWKQQDPQLPKSVWYETDAQWLGFRLVRPAKVPPAEEMYKYWNSGVEHDEQ